MELKERFEKFIHPNCWIWQGGKSKYGYGLFSLDGTSRPAHRIAYEIYIGEIPIGLEVCHTCDNPPCVNPCHLYLGTHLENMRDRDRKGRQAKGQRNGFAKLYDNDVIEIKNMFSIKSIKDIAKYYGVSYWCIYNIKAGRSWKHIPFPEKSKCSKYDL